MGSEIWTIQSAAAAAKSVQSARRTDLCLCLGSVLPLLASSTRLLHTTPSCPCWDALWGQLLCFILASLEVSSHHEAKSKFLICSDLLSLEGGQQTGGLPPANYLQSRTVFAVAHMPWGLCFGQLDIIWIMWQVNISLNTFMWLHLQCMLLY